MNALKQYIDLYDSYKAEIDAGSTGVLNAARTAARQALEGKSLPRKGEEGYEKTSIDDMFAPDFGVDIMRRTAAVDVAAKFRCDVPNISTLMAVVVNDRFVPTPTLTRNMPQGLTVMSLAQAAREMPELVARYYGKIAPLTDTAVALNTLLAQDGVWVHVAKGAKIDKALQIVNMFSSSAPILAPRRVVVALEDDAELRMLICDHTDLDDVSRLSSQVIEIYMGQNARLDYYDIEETSPRNARYNQVFATQASGSNLLINGSTLTCGVTRNDFNITLDGDHCDTRLAAMAIGSEQMHIDNSSSVVHQGEHGHSDQLFKYVLDDRAVGAFEGSITVTPEGRYAEAYQSNRNILASPDARMHTKPQLLIFNDDVKCSHGAATGQLDQAALFYMRTRGIPESEARTMLMQAFMIDVVDAVRLDSLRDRLQHLVENRFSGRAGSCHSCAHSCVPKGE